MDRSSLSRWFAGLCAVAVLALFVGQRTLSAAPKPKDAEAAAEKPAAAKPTAQKREAKKPVAEDEQAPRMPAHFNKVINEQQRPKIVAVLKEFAPRIQQLRGELQALVDKRDEALFKVLSPEQRRQVEELRAETSAKRAAASAGDDATDKAPPESTAPKRSKSNE